MGCHDRHISLCQISKEVYMAKGKKRGLSGERETTFKVEYETWVEDSGGSWEPGLAADTRERRMM